MPEPPELTNLDQKNLGTYDRLENGQTIREYVYDLIPTKDGAVSIGKTTIHHKNPETGAEGEQAVEGVEFAVRSAGSSWTTIILLGACALLAISSIATLIIAQRIRKQREESKRITDLSPIEVLRRDSEELDKCLIEGRNREFSETLAGLMRRWLSIDTGRKLANDTTDQIAEMLNNEERTRPERRRILDILRQCDAVRYAAHQPSKEEAQATLRDWNELLSK